jgi:hypothetical protein
VGIHSVYEQAATLPVKTEEVTMDSVFDPTYPAEQQTAEFWEVVILLAQAEKLIRRIEEGKEPEPRLWSD